MTPHQRGLLAVGLFWIFLGLLAWQTLIVVLVLAYTSVVIMLLFFSWAVYTAQAKR